MKKSIQYVVALCLAVMVSAASLLPVSWNRPALAASIPSLLITELMAYPSDTNEAYEYFELYNNSSVNIDLAGYDVWLYWHNTEPFSSTNMTSWGSIQPYDASSTAIIGPHQTKVVWLKKKSLSGSAAGDLNGFNSLYGTHLTTADLVVLKAPGSGLANGLRRDIGLVPVNGDPQSDRTVGVSFNGDTDYTQGESVGYFYPKDGTTTMETVAPGSFHQSPTPGQVFPYQVDTQDPVILDLVSQKAFQYFWNMANTDVNSPGYGLIAKGVKGNNVNVSSVAGVGFGLTALAIGAERGWVSKAAAEARAIGTLHTLIDHVDQESGFFYHFVQMATGERNTDAEASTVDTVRTVSGAIVAGEYFGGEVKELAQELYDRVNWEAFRDSTTNQFYKGYRPDSGFGTLWSNSGEQLALYVLAAGSEAHPANGNMFYDFTRNVGSYGSGPSYIYSFFGSMHTYLYSHAWVDFRNKVDQQGVNWYENTSKAVQTNRQYAIDSAAQFPTYGADAWGLLAGKGPNGYEGKNGAPPSGNNNIAHRTIGTLSPAGAAAAIAFSPQASIDALNHYYADYPQLWGPYGFYDGFNLAVTPAWYADDYSVINVGAPLLMIENYRSGFVWKWFMNNTSVQQGMKNIGLTGIALPADVVSPVVTWGAGSATIHWSDPVDALDRSEYTFVNIYDQTGAQVAGPLPQGSTSAEIDGLSSSSQYTFKVVRVKDGVESAGATTSPGHPL